MNRSHRRNRNAIHYTPVDHGRTYLSERIILTLTLTLTGCLLLAMETTLFGRISLSSLGMGRAAPSLGFLFCMAAGFLYGESVGGICGLVMGFLADSMDYTRGGSGIMLLPLLYFLCGYISGVIGKRRLAHNLPSFMVFSIIGGGVECVYGVMSATLKSGGVPPALWIYRGLVPIWILTVFFSPVVYGWMYLEKRLIHQRE